MPSENGIGSVGRQLVETTGDEVVVDGMGAERSVRPPTAQAIADFLAEAVEKGEAVTPVGGGTALGLGNLPDRVDSALSTRALDAVLEYEPTDLVLSVGAGARFGDVQRLLHSYGQTLPLDPPDGEDATVGGLIATARSGPLRRSTGTLRDYLVGMAVAHPSGTVTKSGGMVVKNVTGFDLPRLYHGSLGTLGVIVSANFKVLPLAAAEMTLIARAGDLDRAMVTAEAWDRGTLQPASLELARESDGWIVAARILGREQTVISRARDGRGGITDPIEEMSGVDSASWWTNYGRGQWSIVEPYEVIVRCGVRPKGTGPLVQSLVATVPEQGTELRSLRSSVGRGIVQLRVALPDGSPASLLDLQRRLLGMADHVTVLAAPPEWKQGIDVWGKEPDGLDVMRSLKQQFDPHRVLNPGRFIGRI